MELAHEIYCVSAVACLAFKSAKCLRVKNDSFHCRAKNTRARTRSGGKQAIAQSSFIYFALCPIKTITIRCDLFLQFVHSPNGIIVWPQLLVCVDVRYKINTIFKQHIQNTSMILFMAAECEQFVEIYLQYLFERRGQLWNALWLWRAQMTRVNKTATTEQKKAR